MRRAPSTAPAGAPPGTISASAFETGAVALAARWNALARGTPTLEGITARWVRETDATRAAAAARGHVAVEGHLASRRRADEDEDEDDDDAREVEVEVEDDTDIFDDDVACVHSSTSSGAHLRTYHVTYSAAYEVPVLLVAASRASPPRDALSHSRLTSSLLRAAREGGAGADAALVGLGSAGDLAAFAPCDHPHGAAGCWVGAHPCETAAAMRLLLSSSAATSAGGGDGGEATRGDAAAERYVAAWFRFAMGAVSDFALPPTL